MCIEFREYGARVSNEYRGIPKQKIIQIPFYPIIHYEKKFQGYPFPVGDEQKVIFSGGGLYKTLGEENKYYQIVDYILGKYPNTVFWYAGSGERIEMDKIIAKYPGRAYLTEERTDLYQVLKHCYFYLSTYPVCGGLMYQYAAKAEKVPVTLRYGNITDDFLIHQNELGIQFDDIRLLQDEIDHLIKDTVYAENKGKKIKSAVISEESFNSEVAKLFSDEISSYPVQYKHIDTSDFRQIYLDNMTERKVNLNYSRLCRESG